MTEKRDLVKMFEDAWRGDGDDGEQEYSFHHGDENLIKEALVRDAVAKAPVEGFVEDRICALIEDRFTEAANAPDDLDFLELAEDIMKIVQEGV